tara:strand:+ start:389 stop:565 length:177 start_codon:yes stop_codon:yes gene_type:complete
VSPEDDANFLLKELNWGFALWLILVVLWNFGYPGATPILDVIAAVMLFFASKFFQGVV